MTKIRKMIGLIVAVYKGLLPESIIPGSLRSIEVTRKVALENSMKVHVPVVPPQLLILENVNFGGYFENLFLDAHPQIEEFRKQHIYKSKFIVLTYFLRHSTSYN